MTKIFAIPAGENITIRFLEPQPTHEIWLTKEEAARYNAMKHDCPICARLGKPNRT